MPVAATHCVAAPSDKALQPERLLGVKHDALRRLAITARAPGLLIVPLDRHCDVVVDDEPERSRRPIVAAGGDA